jgi:oligopeptide/dipeptide ABC transporter ATP-binding protein
LTEGSAADSSSARRPLLDVRDLTVEFGLGRRRPPLRAVDGVSLTVAARETVGVVGESGSGKTTIGRAILGLTPNVSGSVRFDGMEITHADYHERQRLSADLQVVFQDPYSSLNPSRTIGQTLSETLRGHADRRNRNAAGERARWMLERVGLPADGASRYPAHFSGGQRQRIAIARALMVQPRLVICDEPVSALDLSVQAQVLNLLRELQDEFQLAYLFIAHDLAVVRHVSHRIVVLYRGRIMEEGNAAVVCGVPSHPYTRALLEAAPVADPELQRLRRSVRSRQSIDTSVATSASSCPFVPRCPHALDICRTVRPQLETTPESSHVACHRWRELRQNDPSNGPPHFSATFPPGGGGSARRPDA